MGEKMEFRKITAIIRREKLEEVEEAMHRLGVPGLSVTKVKGYGDYANYFSRDWREVRSRIEIFIGAENAADVVNSILDAASTGLAGDGLVAVLPVEQIYRIRDRAALPTTKLRKQ